MHRQMPSIQRIWSGPGWFGTRRSMAQIHSSESPPARASALQLSGTFALTTKGAVFNFHYFPIKAFRKSKKCRDHFAIPMNEAWLKLTGTYSPAMNSSIPCVIRCSATVRQPRLQRGLLSNHIPTMTLRISKPGLFFISILPFRRIPKNATPTLGWSQR